MNSQTIQNIMQFMMRAQLTGQEVPAFSAAMNALQMELNKSVREPVRDLDDSEQPPLSAEG